MKDFYNKMVDYFADNVQQAALVALVSIVVIFVLVAVLVSAASHSKKKKAETVTQKDTTPKQQNTDTTPKAVKETPAKVEKAPAKVEETPKKVEKAPAKVEETPKKVEKAPIKVEETPKKVEKAPAKVEETPKKVEKAPKKVEKPVEKAVEQTPPEAPMEEPAVQEIAATKPTEKPKATTLHDELKDVNTDISFYEDDGVDQEARYKGKWVICRLVTEDNSSEEMYFFELRASNGEKLLTSEEYTSYNGAIRGIETHKTNILKGNFRVTMSKRGEYIFKLLSGKNMLLCMGEPYATKARCEAAIASAKRFAETAILDENVQYQVVKVPVEDDTPILPPKDGSKGKWIIDCTEMPDGEKVYTFELLANNGERLLASEEYTTYIGAVNGIQTHKTNIQKGNFRIVLTKRGDYIYKLLNSNGQLLCLGEHYKTKRLCQNAVESVKRFAISASVLANQKIKK